MQTLKICHLAKEDCVIYEKWLKNTYSVSYIITSSTTRRVVKKSLNECRLKKQQVITLQKYQDLLSVTSPSFFSFVSSSYNLNHVEKKMWHTDLGWPCCFVIVAWSLACFMHEILLKICITSSVNHKIATKNRVNFMITNTSF